MASSSSMLSEDQFLCPICLDVFNRPVSTPCGHNFCKSCITSYWKEGEKVWCPVCKEHFHKRPDLKVNTFISGLASHFKSLQVTEAHTCSSVPQQVDAGNPVLCDVCTDTQKGAVRSCIECQTSYCDLHLEPHHRAAGLRRHTLVEPVANLEDRLCKDHDKLLTFFCRDDRGVLCDTCVGLRHVQHNVVHVQRACEAEKRTVEDIEAKVQRMIAARLQKAEQAKMSVKQSKTENEALMLNSLQELKELVFEIEKNQVELVTVVERRQKSTEEEAEGFIRDIECETAELQRTADNLKELKETEDPFCFFQRYPSLSLLPPTMDLSRLTVNRPPQIQRIHTSVSKIASQLRVLVNQMSTEIKHFANAAHTPGSTALMNARRHQVNVVLDPDTAHPLLILSPDRKQVRYGMGAGLLGVHKLSPRKFTEHLAVLGRTGFSHRKFYFEVHVGQKTEWCLGVATASIPRRRALDRNAHCGLWAIWFLGDHIETFHSPNEPVYLGKAERIGVFVDYDGGEVSFFDANAATVIYSFTDCLFTEDLHPYFNPCDDEYGANLDPLAIVAVSDAE